MVLLNSRETLGWAWDDFRFLSDGEPACGLTTVRTDGFVAAVTLFPEVHRCLAQRLWKGPLRRTALRQALSEGSGTVTGHLSPSENASGSLGVPDATLGALMQEFHV